MSNEKNFFVANEITFNYKNIYLLIFEIPAIEFL